MSDFESDKITEVLLADGQWHLASELHWTHDGRMVIFMTEGNRRVVAPVAQVKAYRGRP